MLFLPMASMDRTPLPPGNARHESSSNDFSRSISPLLQENDIDTTQLSQDSTRRNSSSGPTYKRPSSSHKIGPDRNNGYDQLRNRHVWTARLESSWTWETCGMCISIACMIAIIATLPYLNNNSLSNWQFLMLPNTMISTFITVTKTSMLLVVAEGISQLKWLYFQTDRGRRLTELQHFDNASRGPWGSLMFLLHTKRAAILASLGALIMVSSLAMDPFGQQIISFQTRYVLREDAQAIVPVAYMYSPQTTESFFGDDWEMDGAVANGLWSLSLSDPISCPTGNCTWPTFSTLGICSSCANVTDNTSFTGCSIQLSASKYDCPDLIQDAISCSVTMTHSSDGAAISDCDEWPQSCNSSRIVEVMSENIYVTTGNASFTRQTQMQVVPESLSSKRADVIGTTWIEYYVSHAQISDEELLHGENKSDIIENVFYLGHTRFSNISNAALLSTHVQDGLTLKDFELGTCPSQELEVIDCRIHWCIKTFENVRTLNGTVQPYDIREIPLDYDLNATISGLRESNVEQPNYAFKSVKGDPLPPPIPSTFLVNARSLSFIANTSLGLFSAQNSATDGYFSLQEPVGNGKNVSMLLSNIVSSMTNRIRTGPNSTSIQGAAYYPEVFVIVRWQWCILPALLVALSFLFFASTVWVTRGSGKPPLWKSNALPLLFHGLDGWSKHELSVSENSHMQTAASRMRARIANDNEGNRKFIKVE